MAQNEIPDEEYSAEKFYAGLLGLDEDESPEEAQAAEKRLDRLREWNE